MVVSAAKGGIWGGEIARRNGCDGGGLSVGYIHIYTPPSVD